MTDDERSLLDNTAGALLRIYSDGIGRLLTRSKRDYDAISQIFTPITETLSALAEAKYGAVETEVRAKIVKEALKGIEKRSAGLTVETAEADLTKLTRSVVVNIAKEVAATKALKELTEASV